MALGLLSPLLVMALFVENWSRDLATNVAWTDPNSSEPRQRPIECFGSWNELQAQIIAFVESRPDWSESQPQEPLPRSSPLHEISAQPVGEFQFHLVRTTAIMRYKDDVWIVAEPIAAELEERIRWRLHGHSQSRVGKGDLGQNPRNLRELLPALAE